MIQSKIGKVGDTMVKPAQVKATQRYVAKHYDRMVVTVPQGKREKIKAAAALAGESMNQYIVNAISDRMEKESD